MIAHIVMLLVLIGSSSADPALVLADQQSLAPPTPPVLAKPRTSTIDVAVPPSLPPQKGDPRMMPNDPVLFQPTPLSKEEIQPSLASTLPIHAFQPSAQPAQQIVSDQEVIKGAKTKATVGPSSEGFFNAMMQYTFEPGQLYQVYCAPLMLTDIQLQPGEELVGKPGLGDTVRWVSGMSESKQGGVTRQHIFVKPTRTDLHTTLILPTNQRVYHLELHSSAETYMVSVMWRYPHDEMAKELAQKQQALKAKEQTIATKVNLHQANFNYVIDVKEGEPRWTPLQVFDDGEKTFIRFPARVTVDQAPALFLMADDDDRTQLVNYRVKKHVYVVDRLFKRAQLRVGQDAQEIVEIRAEEPDTTSQETTSSWWEVD